MEEDEHQKFFRTCKDVRGILCFTSCPLTYQSIYLNLPLKTILDGYEPLLGKVPKVISWRLLENSKKLDKINGCNVPPTSSKPISKMPRSRDFFIK